MLTANDWFSVDSFVVSDTVSLNFGSEPLWAPCIAGPDGDKVKTCQEHVWVTKNNVLSKINK